MQCVRCIVFAVLCLTHYGNLETPVSVNPGEQWVYSFHSNTTVGNNLSADAVSQWRLSGKLTLLSFQQYKIIKLDELKTSAYNGPVDNLDNVPNVQPPGDTSILSEPFIAYYNKNYDKLVSLRFSPNEPEWSMNIKKAFASVYQLDFGPNAAKQELNILGKCRLNHENLSNDSNTVILKEIQHKYCDIENSPRHTWGNVAIGHFTGRTVRTYTYDRVVSNSDVPLTEIKSETILKYWTMWADRTVHEIKQMHQFNLISTKPITNSLDISKYSMKRSPAYELEDNDRIATNKETDKTLINKWLTLFETFRNQINQTTSSHLQEQNFNMIEKLRNILTAMDMKAFNTFLSKEFADDKQLISVFGSLLPYVGTNDSVKFIKELYFNQSLAEISGLRLLATFPFFVKSPSEKMLDDLEELLKDDLGNQTVVKHTFILSFSNLIYQLYYAKLQNSNNKNEADLRYKTIAEKYAKLYFKLQHETDDYNTRMKYILGMMNIGEASTDYLMKIVRNETECRHIRVLATYAIKPQIKYKKQKVFDQFWPIVKNASEHFEIRAVTLSLLLESNINSTELFSMMSYMKQTSYDAKRQHLHNYFYTTMQAGKEDCESCTINKFAKSILSDLTPPETNQGLLSGYHQVTYSDDEQNFKGSLNLHVLANPVTNFATVVQATVSHYTGHHKTGSFSVYVKAEGISERLYREEYERHIPVKELFNILHEIKLALNQGNVENLHIEVILYYEERAVFAFHIDEDNVFEMADYIDQLIVYFGNNDIITLRDVRSSHFVSDLGTPIYSTLTYDHVLSTDFKNVDKLFLDEDDKDEDENYISTGVRSAWSSKMSFISYNPITNINHGVTKIYSNKFFLMLKIDYNVYDLSLKWNDKDTYFDVLIDHKFALYVNDADNLEKYCTHCNPVHFLEGKNKTDREVNLWLWIKNIKIRDINCTNQRFSKNVLHEMIKKSQVSYAGLPFAQPFVLIFYLADYLYYIPPYDAYSFSINTQHILDEPNEAIVKITFNADALDENFKLNLNFNITLALLQKRLTDGKVLNQWNLNIQRQEYEKGVSYQLHYDDDKKTSSFDLISRLDYLPALANTDMFSLTPAEPIIGKTSIRYKENASVLTKIEITSLFSVSDEQKLMINNSKSYDICRKDYQQPYFRDIIMNHAPPTKSCYNVSLGLSTYDHYAIDMEFKDVSDKLKQALDHDILRTIISNDNNDKIYIKDNTFNASMAYSALNSIININVNDNLVVKDYKVPELLRPRALLKPTMKFVEELRYNSFGLDNICIIIPHHVITFTGKVVEYDLESSVLPLIECMNNTRVGLAYNRHAYKLWSDNNAFQFGKKNQGGFYVLLNGKHLKRSTHAEDYMIEIIKDNTFRITTNRIELYYNGEYLVIKIKSAFINRMCGTCVSGDLTAHNMMYKYFN